ncbi:MAG: hypothetical protein WD176_05760, partial [Pirellulales bacterium]
MNRSISARHAATLNSAARLAVAFLGIACCTSPILADPTPLNLQLWFRADAGVLNALGMPAANNDPVATWLEQTSNHFDTGQTNANRRPTYVTSGPDTINGLPTVKFDFTGGAGGADELFN